uniref:Neurobeachin alpha-solenoid region domain-containing protein n=1 Tax=Oryza nivara TaxID=4536 RepID=A0A0E0GD50_ORYNI
MNIVRGVADLLRKAPAPPPAPPAVPSSSFGVREGSFHGADQDVAPSPRVVFSDSTEERVLNTLWKKYENALNKAEKEKSLQIFVLQFVQTFRDWGPYHNIHLVDQEQGSDETVVGCSHGHPSEVILILIQEMSIITSTIAESGNSPESSPNYSEQPGDLGLSTERLHVLECLTILTRSMHNCRVFSYYGGVKKVTSLLKAAVAQLKIQNSLLAADNHVSCQAVENIKMMLNMLKYIVTIISNFMKLEPTILRIPHFLNSTKCASSKNHLATVTPSTSESGIFDTLQRWQQRAIVLVMGAGGVNSLVELLRVIQRLNSEQWTDLSLHFITLCTLRSTISGTRAQNHVRSIGGLEILLDGLGLPSSKFSVLKNSSIPKDESTTRSRSSSERVLVFSLLAVVDVPHSVTSTGGSCPWRRRKSGGVHHRRRCNASRTEFGCRGQRHAGEWPWRACWVELRAASWPAKRIRAAPDPCQSRSVHRRPPACALAMASGSGAGAGLPLEELGLDGAVLDALWRCAAAAAPPPSRLCSAARKKGKRKEERERKPCAGMPPCVVTVGGEPWRCAAAAAPLWPPSRLCSAARKKGKRKEERGRTVFGNVNNLQFLCENGRVHKFANCICWPAFMILEFHRQRDNTGPSLALDSISGPIYFLDITEWREYSVKLSNALCSFIIPSKVISYCRNEIACNKISLSIPSAYREQSVRWFIRVLMTVFLCIKACTSETELPNHIKILAKTLQLYMIRTFRMVLVSKPTLLTAFREEGVWDLIFSENCFYFGSSVEDMQFHIVAEVQNEDINGNTEPTDSESLYLSDVNILQLEAISFLEYAATLNENKYNLPECSALLEALEHCIYDPVVVSILLKSFRVILQLATEQTLVSFKSLDVITGVLKAACQQAKELQNFSCFPSDDVISSGYGSKIENIEMSSSGKRTEYAIICIELALSLFKEYVTISSYGRILILHNPDCIECLFNLFQEKNFRKHVLEQIFALFRVKLCIFQIFSFDLVNVWNYNTLTVYFNQLPPSSKQDHAAKLQLCSKYLENFTRANEKEKVNSELLVDLLVNMREIIMMDRMYYQNLFRDGGCFLYIVSLLNGTFNEATGEQLVLNVLETLTLLLEGNDASKASFRMLVGVGYQTLQSLLLDFYKWLPSPSERLLHALLSMLNEDVVILVLNILQKSSTSLQHYGLVVLQQLLKQSIANRTSCFRAGLLSYLLDWFSVEERDDTVGQIADLIQIIGAHSISGKDIRKIFALLRCGKIVAKKKHSSLLLTCLSHMLKEKGPEAFFEFDGHDSGIEIKSPFQWPYNRGLSFSCWLRVENFPENGMMGLFSFFTEDGKGCSAVLSKSALVYEVMVVFLLIQNSNF